MHTKSTEAEVHEMCSESQKRKQANYWLIAPEGMVSQMHCAWPWGEKGQYGGGLCHQGVQIKQHMKTEAKPTDKENRVPCLCERHMAFGGPWMSFSQSKASESRCRAEKHTVLSLTLRCERQPIHRGSRSQTAQAGEAATDRLPG